MPARIAILDGEPMSYTSLAEALAAAGYEPVMLVAGIGVHEVLRDLAPAAMILDVSSDPCVVHWPALAVLAHDAVLRAIPLVACVPADGSAEADAARRVAALGLPATTLLCKPVAVDDLVARVRRIVEDAGRL
jgi:DNA-binding response OmpR family regulator